MGALLMTMDDRERATLGGRIGTNEEGTAPLTGRAAMTHTQRTGPELPYIFAIEVMNFIGCAWWAFALAYTPTSIKTIKAFSLLYQLAPSNAAWVMTFAVGAAMTLTAYLHRGITIRAVALCIGAAVWMLVAISIYRVTPYVTSVGPYIGYSVGCIMSAYRLSRSA